MTLKVSVIAPDKVVLDEETSEVILPSSSGKLGILTDHAPLLTALDIGVMQVRSGKEWKNISLMGGFAEVEHNEIKILVNGAELSSDIDAEEARQEYEEAEKNMEKANQTGELRQKLKATTAFKKARARLQAIGGI